MSLAFSCISTDSLVWSGIESLGYHDFSPSFQAPGQPLLAQRTAMIRSHFALRQFSQTRFARATTMTFLLGLLALALHILPGPVQPLHAQGALCRLTSVTGWRSSRLQLLVLCNGNQKIKGRPGRTPIDISP